MITKDARLVIMAVITNRCITVLTPTHFVFRKSEWFTHGYALSKLGIFLIHSPNID